MFTKRDDVFGKVYNVKHLKDDKPVQNGLSMSPSEMQRMSERGVPVTTQNNEALFYDGETRPSWDVPLDQQRGVDIATMWQRRKDLGAKINQNVNELIEPM